VGHPELSVVIPVYNEEKRIRKTLSRLIGYLERRHNSYEAIVINDGSSDCTSGILEELTNKYQTLRLFHNSRNHGKGFAVRQGMLEAKGDFIFFTDADLSTPAQEIGRFMQIFKKHGAAILIGSRSIPGAHIKIKQPCYRRNMGRVFNLVVKCMTPLRFQDTQCGFKAFRREAAQKIFPRAKQNGFAFDVEILLLAQKFGLPAEEIPVTWVNNRRSQVRPFADSFRMFRELLEIRKIAKQS